MKKAADKAKQEKAAVDVEAYAGHYDAQPWWGETGFLPWQGKLAIFELPSENPVIPHDFTRICTSEHSVNLMLLLNMIFFSHILFEHNCK